MKRFESNVLKIHTVTHNVVYSNRSRDVMKEIVYWEVSILVVADLMQINTVL